MPSEDAGQSQTRRKRRWVGERKASKPGQKPGRRLFTPGDRDWQPLGMESTVARKAITKREAQRAEAEFLSRHFKLVNGSLPPEEDSTKLGPDKRQARFEALNAFPRMPEADLQELQRIIGAYGLPLVRLDSDTAAFVMRRVMLDYFRLNILKRAAQPGLFTPEELLELMHVANLTPTRLAEITHPLLPHNGLTNIQRWLNKASVPTGLHAIRVNRLIDQHVRRRGKSRDQRREQRRGYQRGSIKPETVARSARQARADAKRGRIEAPLASAARKALESEGDA